MVYPEPIALADITPGMDVQAVVTWTATGATSTTRGLITSSSFDHLGFDSGLTSPTSDSAPSGATVNYLLMSAPPATTTEPANGTIALDEAGAAWQNLSGSWCSINGDRLTWSDFLTAHPTYTIMQDTPIVPLPAPVSPYPAAITPADAHSGMDIQATVTYTAGGSKVVRGICVWVQDNNPGPDYLAMSLSTGDVFQYDPVPDGQTLTVEQMQAWTADATWPFVNVAEPAIGTIIRDAYGIAWQRITDAAADDPNPGVTPGKGRWFNVTQSITIREVTTALAPGEAIYTLPISWFWLWGVAAPFNVQEATP